MNPCAGAPAEQFVGPYIEGSLSEVEMKSFEEHFFDCSVCLAHLEVLQTLQQQFSTNGDARKADSNAASIRRSPLRWRRPVQVLLTIAAAAIIAVIGYRMLGTHPAQNRQTQVASVLPSTAAPGEPLPITPHNEATVVELADLEMPAYTATNLRGEATDSSFVTGMKLYAHKNCRAAISALLKTPSNDTEFLAAQFYAGVCQIHDHDSAAGTATLGRVASAKDSPQQEAALYYLAQDALARNDRNHAREYLNRTAALHGDFEMRARRQVASLANGSAK